MTLHKIIAALSVALDAQQRGANVNARLAELARELCRISGVAFLPPLSVPFIRGPISADVSTDCVTEAMSE